MNEASAIAEAPSIADDPDWDVKNGEEEGEEKVNADLAPEFGDEAKLFCTEGYAVTATKLCLGAVNCDGGDDEFIVGSTVKVKGLTELEVKSVKFDADGTRHVVLYAPEIEVV